MSDDAPETGPDGRERPRYGEYATPEEQRARIRQPDVTWALETGEGTTAAPASAPVAPAAAVPVPADPAKPRTVDRIATAALLAYGLFTVITSAPRFADYTEFADIVLQAMGVDATLSDPAGARAWGIAAAAVLVLGWVAAALWSWTRLRAGRLAWWIPLVAGVVVNVVASVFMVVPLMTDPAVLDAITTVVTP